MFDLGTQELIVIFIVAFLVFGPKKLPELGRTLGKGIRELKAAMRGVKDTFEEAGADVTEEIKSAKSNLEDSIYKSLEPHVESAAKDGKEETRHAEGGAAAGQEGTDRKESEKNG